MRQHLVLVVDDEKDIRDVITVYLNNENIRTIEAADGIEALEVMSREMVDLVILDVMMPRLDGIMTCRKIREQSEVQVLMLSAKQEDIDKINGLTMGADDYLGKPFNPLELVARVKAQLRRSQRITPQQDEHYIQIGSLIIDFRRHLVSIGEKKVQLTPLEFGILELLGRHRGQVFSANHIYEAVWKERAMNSENNVMAHIRNLREKIETNPREPRFIKTVWGVGYKIDA
ncbi:response regulator transcription factor [Paenibacillus sp. PR3]|uniref:Response regulator transcription factor n=1 Tax=Paenibacillus terricola TaxID=2763503 RepID=A0ABR8MVL4_9BACL|nr:response regulator transcription factor [Paenibacillus terricola]MBD3919992.1 response regulator transcription factor [Paenibacillus terricola]